MVISIHVLIIKFDVLDKASKVVVKALDAFRRDSPHNSMNPIRSNLLNSNLSGVVKLISSQEGEIIYKYQFPCGPVWRAITALLLPGFISPSRILKETNELVIFAFTHHITIIKEDIKS